LQIVVAKRTYIAVKGEEKIAPPSGASWTRPDAYIGAMARKRTYRKAREDKPRTQPVAPWPWLSTVPFIAVLAVLAVLAVAIMFVAFPGSQPVPKVERPAAREQGVAPPGWFQKAQKQFHK
jgi:hypothetical protein